MSSGRKLGSVRKWVSPEALVAEGAGLAVRLYVCRLPADPERHRHLPDSLAQCFALQEVLDCGAEGMALPVDLERRQEVDGLALSLVVDLWRRRGRW